MHVTKTWHSNASRLAAAELLYCMRTGIDKPSSVPLPHTYVRHPAVAHGPVTSVTPTTANGQ